MSIPGSPTATGVKVPRPYKMTPTARPLASSLMAAAALALFVLSAVHFGLPLPLGALTVRDPFFTAIPEAVLGAVEAVGAATLAVGLRNARVTASAATLITILGVLVGFGIMVYGGRLGDIVYHLFLLAGLLVTLVILRGQSQMRAIIKSRRGESKQ